MGDNFLDAVAQGRRAALAEKNRQEIQSVLDELDEQIRAYTGGRLGVARVSGAGPQAGCPPEAQNGRVFGELVLVGGDLRQTLCGISECQGEFSVRMWYRGTYASAGSRDGLVKELNKLLSSPEVGRVFNTILGSPDTAMSDPGKP